MPSSLAFPAYQAYFPEFAGVRLETMEAIGYSRGLTQAEMSATAGIMAITDIFEALTIADRPYKKPETLCQAKEIIGRSRDEGHIDANWLALILESGANEQSARQHLALEQIDKVNINEYMSYSTQRS